MHTRLTVASRHAAPLSDVVGLSAAADDVGIHRRTKGAVDARAVPFTFITAVAVPALSNGPATGAVIP